MGEKRTRDETSIRANTFDEVRRGLHNAKTDMEPELKIKGEKWEPGHLLEAIAADYLTMPRAERLRRALRGQAVIEAIRQREEEGQPLSEADAPEPTGTPSGSSGPITKGGHTVGRPAPKRGSDEGHSSPPAGTDRKKMGAQADR